MEIQDATELLISLICGSEPTDKHFQDIRVCLVFVVEPRGIDQGEPAPLYVRHVAFDDFCFLFDVSISNLTGKSLHLLLVRVRF